MKCQRKSLEENEFLCFAFPFTTEGFLSRAKAKWHLRECWILAISSWEKHIVLHLQMKPRPNNELAFVFRVFFLSVSRAYFHIWVLRKKTGFFAGFPASLLENFCTEFGNPHSGLGFTLQTDLKRINSDHIVHSGFTLQWRTDVESCLMVTVRDFLSPQFTTELRVFVPFNIFSTLWHLFLIWDFLQMSTKTENRFARRS